MFYCYYCSLLCISYSVHVNLLLRNFLICKWEKINCEFYFLKYLNIHLHYIRQFQKKKYFFININKNSTSSCPNYIVLNQILFKVNEELDLFEIPEWCKNRVWTPFFGISFPLWDTDKSYNWNYRNQKKALNEPLIS